MQISSQTCWTMMSKFRQEFRPAWKTGGLQKPHHSDYFKRTLHSGARSGRKKSLRAAQPETRSGNSITLRLGQHDGTLRNPLVMLACDQVTVQTVRGWQQPITTEPGSKREFRKENPGRANHNNRNLARNSCYGNWKANGDFIRKDEIPVVFLCPSIFCYLWKTSGKCRIFPHSVKFLL